MLPHLIDFVNKKEGRFLHPQQQGNIRSPGGNGYDLVTFTISNLTNAGILLA